MRLKIELSRKAGIWGMGGDGERRYIAAYNYSKYYGLISQSKWGASNRSQHHRVIWLQNSYPKHLVLKLRGSFHIRQKSSLKRDLRIRNTFPQCVRLHPHIFHTQQRSLTHRESEARNSGRQMIFLCIRRDASIFPCSHHQE
jgi:hypothetical protein